MAQEKFDTKSCLYDLFGLIVVIILLGCGIYYSSSEIRTKVDGYLFSKDSTMLEEDTVMYELEDSIKFVQQIENDIVLETTPTHLDTISLAKNEDNLYYIIAHVNGIPMRFALDTGCTNLYISPIEFEFLKRQGLISGELISSSQSIIANGDTINNLGQITLDSIQIGTRVAKNINCTVSSNTNTPLLLGQDVLSKLGDITIKYNKNILIIE